MREACALVPVTTIAVTPAAVARASTAPMSARNALFVRLAPMSTSGAPVLPFTVGSRRGSVVGSEPPDEARAHADEVHALRVLAADLAPQVGAGHGPELE